MPLVSVIIPVYNRETFIAGAIQSVIDQTCKDWELILIDDGSTDSSLMIIKQFIQVDNRIMLDYRRNEVKGPSACRNIGAKRAKGKYLIFLDSDDFIAPFCLEQRIGIMSQNPELDFGIFNLNFFNDHTISQQHLLNKDAKDSKAFLKFFFQLKTPWATPCPIWKSSFFISVGGFNEQFLVKTDPELHSRVLLLHQPLFKYFKDTQPDCFYRHHEDEVKMQYIRHAAIYYRIKFIKQSYNLINIQTLFPKMELLQALGEGTLTFYKTYFINASSHYPQDFFDFLKWTFSVHLVNRYRCLLLYCIGFVKTSNNTFYKKFHIAGLIYRLL